MESERGSLLEQIDWLKNGAAEWRRIDQEHKAEHDRMSGESARKDAQIKALADALEKIHALAQGGSRWEMRQISEHALRSVGRL